MSIVAMGTITWCNRTEVVVVVGVCSTSVPGLLPRCKTSV